MSDGTGRYRMRCAGPGWAGPGWGWGMWARLGVDWAGLGWAGLSWAVGQACQCCVYVVI
jgi:hypothetical protein